MNQLTHWNPLRTLSRPDAGGLDALFRDFGLRPPIGLADAPDIRIDLSESAKAYTVRADIPGTKKEDIEIAVEGRQVSITARAHRSSEFKEETSLYSERSEGQSYRSFSLPTEVDDSSAEARYENGVLTLTLPKKAGGTNHRIKVV